LGAYLKAFMGKIKLKYRGAIFELDTPKEAAEMMVLLEDNERRAAREMNRTTVPLDALDHTNNTQYVWTPDMFNLFISRLGAPQRGVLVLLVLKNRVTDKELCKELGIPGNQALAGTLSGITKQAAILDIPAREVFKIENTRKGRQRSNTYSIAESFLTASQAQKWVFAPTQK
jgi:hypothetical protein